MKDSIPFSTCFYHFGNFIVPAGTGDPWNDPTQKCLTAHISGKGRIDALCFRTNYHGVWFGYQVDDYPLDVAHNGCCLKKMGLVGEVANGMPFYLPYYNSPEDLSVACRHPIEFSKNVKIWVGNSDPEKDRLCIGLHIYVTGYDIKPAPGNMTDWSVVVEDSPAGRAAHTLRSGEEIKLIQQKGK